MWVPACVGALAAAGCVGSVIAPTGSPDAPLVPTPGTPPPMPMPAPTPGSAGPKFNCADPSSRGVGENQLRRLITPELTHTLTDLLGTNVMADAAIQAQLSTLPADVIKLSVADIAPTPADIQAATMLNIASRVADLAAADATLRDRIFGTCSSMSTVAGSCAQTFITTFGARVYRRPLSNAESTSLLADFQATGGIGGLQAVLMRLLMAPSLVFHVELGASVQGTRVRLSDYEVAARISYGISGTMPDDALMQAAANGQLQTVDGVRQQSARLLSSSPMARAKTSDFFRFYTKSDQVIPPYAPAGRLDGFDVTGLQAELTQETSDFVDHVVWDLVAPFKTLLTSADVFPRSAAMAKVLQTAQASGSTPEQTTAAHAGLLLRPGLLSSSAPLTKPYHRAATVRRGYLCETLGDPDPNAVAARQGELGDLSALGNRDRLTLETSPPTCLGCHGMLNPAGFPLEGYDQLGMLRQVETDYDASGAVKGTHPLDTTVMGHTFLYDATGAEITSLQDGISLEAAIAAGEEAKACFAQRIFEYQHARRYVAQDLCALSDVEAAAQDSSTIQAALISGVANEDIFWKAQGN
jgi:hypothetical protein